MTRPRKQQPQKRALVARPPATQAPSDFTPSRMDIDVVTRAHSDPWVDVDAASDFYDAFLADAGDR